MRFIVVALLLTFSPHAATTSSADSIVYTLARWDTENLKWRNRHKSLMHNIRHCGNYLFTAEVSAGNIVQKMTGFALADNNGRVAELILRSKGLRIRMISPNQPASVFQSGRSTDAREVDELIIGLPPQEFELFRFLCVKFDTSRAT